MSGIYIHIPYCKKACDYCNFHFTTSLRNKESLIRAIGKEIELRKDYMGNSLVETIYFGGGTPSILDPVEIERILFTIQQHFSISANAEISLEANPDDLNQAKIKAFKEIGINRFSIGIQSFHHEDLKFLGRIHTAGEAIAAIEHVLEAGFKNTTIDLIYGIPGSDEKRWQQNLNMVKKLEIPHLSAYSLTVEPKTIYENKIRKGQKPDVDDDLVREQYYTLKDFATQENFLHYEISNFAKAGYESLHNSNYWKQKTYLGVGPSAHSYNGNSRQWNLALNTKYIDCIYSGQDFFEVESLSPKDHTNEFIMLSLRTHWGLDMNKLFAIDNEFNREKFNNQIEYYINMEFLEKKNHVIHLTDEGILFSDMIISDLFVE